MEAALRTVADVLTVVSLENIDYHEVSGLKDKEANVKLLES